MRTTLQDVYNSRIPDSAGMCAGDKRLLALINEATERLLYEGKWWGTYQRFNMCATDGCITLPRQFATIEKAAVCHQSIPIHDLWFEFIDNGAGTRDECSTWNEANYKGNFCTFADIIPTGKKLKLICDVAADVGVQVLALGYDDNNNWIRTNQGGVILDGELIALAQGNGTLSVNNFSSVTDIQLPVRSGQVWLYEWNVAAGTPRMIGQYQADETRPSYPRYFFPWLNAFTQSQGKSMLVEVIAKLQFIPVLNQNDYLIVGCIPALKEMVVALNKSENESDSMKANGIISAGMTTAKRILEAELDHHLGSGRRIGINIQGSGNPDGEPVHSFL